MIIKVHGAPDLLFFKRLLLFALAKRRQTVNSGMSFHDSCCFHKGGLLYHFSRIRRKAKFYREDSRGESNKINTGTAVRVFGMLPPA